jgi:hypothetical protein
LCHRGTSPYVPHCSMNRHSSQQQAIWLLVLLTLRSLGEVISPTPAACAKLAASKQVLDVRLLDHQYCLSEPLSNLALPGLPAGPCSTRPRAKAPQPINEICADITARSLGRVRADECDGALRLFKLAIPKCRVAPLWNQSHWKGEFWRQRRKRALGVDR